MDDAERAAEALARIRDGKPPLPEPLPTKETWRSVRDSTCILEGPFYHALILPLYNYNLIIGSGKVGWTYETVVPCMHLVFVCSSLLARQPFEVTVAAMTYESLPNEMMMLLQSPTWRGGRVIKLASELARPTVAEISLHYRWLKPWATLMPSKVPSGYLITDVFLVLNRLLEGKLLVVKDNESVRGRAAEEACRLRKLIQGLRYLYRSSDLVANYVCNSCVQVRGRLMSPCICLQIQPRQAQQVRES